MTTPSSLTERTFIADSYANQVATATIYERRFYTADGTHDDTEFTFEITRTCCPKPLHPKGEFNRYELAFVHDAMDWAAKQLHDLTPEALG